MIADGGQVQLADGPTMSYTRYGAHDGPTVVVLDGAGSRAQTHGAALVAARFGISLLAPNRPGFRGSTPDPELTLQRGADAITDLIDRLQIERASVLAQSLGAPFALALAHRHPDRLDGLGLVGPIGPLDVEGACEGMDRPTRMLLLLARRAPLVLDAIFRSIR